MIEVTIYDFLKDNLSVPVYMERPETPPEEYVMLEKTASSRFNLITESTFAVQSYADTLYNAVVLNDEVKNVMDELVTLDSIGKIGLNSDYNFTDTASKQYRYQAVFNITHYD